MGRHFMGDVHSSAEKRIDKRADSRGRIRSGAGRGVAAALLSAALAALFVFRPAAGTVTARAAFTKAEAPAVEARGEGAYESAAGAPAAADAEGTVAADKAAKKKKSEKAAETVAEEPALRVHLAGAPGDPDPARVMDADTASLLGLISEGLTALDRDGNVVPGCAESWKTSKDGLKWTFKLRKKLRWSDGESMDAGDFAAMFRMIADPSSEALYGQDLTGSIAGYEEVLNGDVKALEISAPDDRTLVVKLTAPDPGFAKICAAWALLPVREQIERGKKAGTAEDWEKVTGNGPYRIVSFKEGRQIILERNPYYNNKDRINTGRNTDGKNAGRKYSDGGVEPYERVQWNLTGDVHQEYSDFLNGRFDVISEIPGEEKPGLETEQEKGLLGAFFSAEPKEDGILAEERIVPDVIGITFNCGQKALADSDVRRALAMTIDRDYIASELLEDIYVPAGNVEFPEAEYPLADYDDGTATEAIRLLEKAKKARKEKKKKQLLPTLTCLADKNGPSLFVSLNV